jgi:hypothetical protein
MSSDEPEFIEPRWPIALAVSVYIAMSLVLRAVVPRREAFAPHWLLPAGEIVLLLILVGADPLRADGRTRWLRRVSITLIVLLVMAEMLKSAVLIVQLITGTGISKSADSLLAAGALVWFGNAIVFGLLYWQLDGGGPYPRYLRERPYPDFAFSQQLNPELAPAGWRPRYVDYLMLGVTTSTAFSPTDVMPMVPWAKLTMGLQSLISLTVIGLVIARAVNVFS